MGLKLANLKIHKEKVEHKYMISHRCLILFETQKMAI
jgi:hypothetical protein